MTMFSEDRLEEILRGPEAYSSGIAPQEAVGAS